MPPSKTSPVQEDQALDDDEVRKLIRKLDKFKEDHEKRDGSSVPQAVDPDIDATDRKSDYKHYQLYPTMTLEAMQEQIRLLIRLGKIHRTQYLRVIGQTKSQKSTPGSTSHFMYQTEEDVQAEGHAIPQSFRKKEHDTGNPIVASTPPGELITNDPKRHIENTANSDLIYTSITQDLDSHIDPHIDPTFNEIDNDPLINSHPIIGNALVKYQLCLLRLHNDGHLKVTQKESNYIEIQDFMPGTTGRLIFQGEKEMSANENTVLESFQEKQHDTSNPVVTSTAPGKLIANKSKRLKHDSKNNDASYSIAEDADSHIDPTSNKTGTYPSVNSPINTHLHYDIMKDIQVAYDAQLRILEYQNQKNRRMVLEEHDGFESWKNTPGQTDPLSFQVGRNIPAARNAALQFSQKEKYDASNPGTTSSGSKKRPYPDDSLSGPEIPFEWRVELCGALGVANNVDDGTLQNLLQDTVKKSQKYDSLAQHIRQAPL